MVKQKTPPPKQQNRVCQETTTKTKQASKDSANREEESPRKKLKKQDIEFSLHFSIRSHTSFTIFSYKKVLFRLFGFICLVGTEKVKTFCFPGKDLSPVTSFLLLLLTISPQLYCFQSKFFSFLGDLFS